MDAATRDRLILSLFQGLETGRLDTIGSDDAGSDLAATSSSSAAAGAGAGASRAGRGRTTPDAWSLSLLCTDYAPSIIATWREREEFGYGRMTVSRQYT